MNYSNIFCPFTVFVRLGVSILGSQRWLAPHPSKNLSHPVPISKESAKKFLRSGSEPPSRLRDPLKIGYDFCDGTGKHHAPSFETLQTGTTDLGKYFRTSEQKMYK